MRFWDTSALVPLAVREASSIAMKLLAELDRSLLVSFITPLEVEASLRRKARFEAIQIARRRLVALQGQWTIVAGTERTLDRAKALVAVHALRAADAIQLAAALIARDRGMLFDFVTLDTELRTAAAAEGFTVLP